jgi:hypothetical protein
MEENSDMAAHLSSDLLEPMALCDQLEQQLSQADQQRRRLLEAVLVEELAEPDDAAAQVGCASSCSNGSAALSILP